VHIATKDAKIVYRIEGNGPALVLLHPFPAHSEFWQGVAPLLASSYRLVMPDLRGHGDSPAGDGDATMQDHAADLAGICDAAGVKRGIFAGVSIGGYILFEFWRRYPDRVRALILCDTKAQPDTPDARSDRLKMAEQVERSGTSAYIETMVPKLLGESTRARRPKLVEQARGMMSRPSAPAMASVLRGMASRPDSVATLSTINVPTLVMVGEEDKLTPRADSEFIHTHIRGSQLQVIPAAGHYAPFEQSEAAAKIMLSFLRGLASDVK
jgi:pimeloyl-ACP methyl ester carboxylesterase